mmetsp:Transcript_5154/g.12467  ORF Transcript_5154/g.12467 Transcript_5154/m.12467 type:complete len:264 (+) Transcript_5154:98-889(+)
MIAGQQVHNVSPQLQLEAEGPPRTPAKRIPHAGDHALRADASGEATTTAAAAPAGDSDAPAAVSAAVGVPVMKPVDAAGTKAERLALGVQSCPEKASHSWLPVEEEEEEDCCCICLDTFDEDSNPAKVTKCGHKYHIQCLMAWRQRSDSCPMCFRTLELQDEEAQALLDSIGSSTQQYLRRDQRPVVMAHRTGSVPIPRTRAMSVPAVLQQPSGAGSMQSSAASSAGAAAAAAAATSPSSSSGSSFSMANFKKMVLRKFRGRL